MWTYACGCSTHSTSVLHSASAVLCQISRKEMSSERVALSDWVKHWCGIKCAWRVEYGEALPKCEGLREERQVTQVCMGRRILKTKSERYECSITCMWKVEKVTVVLYTVP